MVTEILAVSAALTGPLLALPLELVAGREVGLVLKLGSVGGLIQRYEQENVPLSLYIPRIPNRRREFETEQRRNLFSRVTSPKLQLSTSPAEWRETPSIVFVGERHG